MKALLAAAATLAVIAAAPAAAQQRALSDPVVGAPNPEALFTSKDKKLNANKQAALHIERELLQCNQWDRAGEWLTPAYHQHNPNAASGLEGVVTFFTKVVKVKRVDNCGTLTAPVVAVMADGPYVTVLTPRKYPDPRHPGQQYITSWFDTWRFVDGKADEHWDPATVNPPAAR
jgi:predicted SnoaL-like aldol condensation-catalyzing enzyme